MRSFFTLLVLLVLVTPVFGGSVIDRPDIEVSQLDGTVYLYWYVDTYDQIAYEGLRFTVEFKALSDNNWQSVYVGRVNEATLEGLKEGETYEFRLLSQSPAGVNKVFEVNTPLTVSDPELQAMVQVPKQTGDYDLEIVKLQSLLYSGNRFNFIDVTLDSAGQGWPYLNTSHFTVHEDGVLQTDYFEVVPPDTPCYRTADIVFLIDNSGSMSGEIAQVRNNAIAFGDSLHALGIDYRLGAVRFGQSSGGGQPYIYGPLTDDVTVFHSWISAMGASGGFEPGLQACINAATYFSFRPGSSRHFILITDEDSDGGSLSEAINLCNNNNITVHARALQTSGSSWAHYCGPNGIAQQTGGTVDNVTAPFWNILDNIGVCDNYLVKYRPSNDVCDGIDREVVVCVQHGAHSDCDTVYYTPCMCPVVTVTPDTRALEQTMQMDGLPLLIQCWVVDNVQPFVQSVTLHYRTTGSTTYQVEMMQHLHDSLYSFQIPGGYVAYPGLDYYITATDGECVASAPSVDPDILPYQIAVYPNEPPSIVHDTLGPTQPLGINLAVNAEVIDSTYSLIRVELFYRRYLDLLYTHVSMTHVGGDNYTGTIPGTVNVTGGCEYYIVAEDDLGLISYHGDADNPHQINIGFQPVPPLDSLFGYVYSNWPLDPGEIDYAKLIGLEGVMVYLSANDGTPPAETMTDDEGYFLFRSLVKSSSAHYTATIQLPLGFEPGTPLSQDVTIRCDEARPVVFGLWDAADDFPRNLEWWQRQLARIRDGGATDFTMAEEDVNGYALDIYKHFYNRDDCYAIRIPGITCIGAPPQAMCFNDVCCACVDGTPFVDQGAFSTLELRCRRSLLIAMLNISIGFTSEQSIVSVDKATYSQALIYFSKLYELGDYSHAGDIESISEGLLIPAGVIPLNTPNVMFKGGDQPETVPSGLPDGYTLEQNYPNPFNPVTEISFALPEAGKVRLEVFNVVGRKVATLADGWYSAGHYSVVWDASMHASGVYLYRLEVDRYSQTRKMILLK